MYPCTAESAQGNVEKAMAPIGFPTPRAILRILDPALRPVPIGIPGELCIAGSQLADGYFRNPSLTDAKFVHAHFSAESTPERLYRSGDLCRWRSDGCIEYLGRIDRQVWAFIWTNTHFPAVWFNSFEQVKIRGMRVEIEDIEHNLSTISFVSQCCVELRGVGPSAVLVAYVVVSSSLEGATVHSWDEKKVRNILEKSLPKHMVPTFFVVLDSMPYTNSGKIDRRKLPDPQELG
jgi:acyl-CoA synthetase (AMP-forming)/AMP-acid ligase II